MKYKIVLTDSHDFSPFYKGGEEILVSTKDMTYSSLWDEGYFLYDMIFRREGDSLSLAAPWQDKRALVKVVMEMWEKDGEPALQKFFLARDRNEALSYMLKYTSIYIQAMFWLSNSEVRSLQEIGAELEKMSYAPMNVKDRIEFILQSPSHYHSFVTLTQLFTESRKKWALYLK